ncbi:MAG: methyltransferase domain-containing protein [Acidobacteriota bacterium]
MSGYGKALLDVFRAYAHSSPSARVHTLVRFLSCPFLRTIDLIPMGSRMLDVGSGHGLLAVLAATNRQARVFAVDPDLRKLLPGLKRADVRMVAGYDNAIRGRFDVVTLFDVIYRLGPAERDGLFERLFQRLEPGGTMIIKEVTPDKRLKTAWNEFQEWIVERLGLTMGHGVFAESPVEVRRRLERHGFIAVEQREIDRWYPHPHIVYFARRPG